MNAPFLESLNFGGITGKSVTWLPEIILEEFISMGLPESLAGSRANRLPISEGRGRATSPIAHEHLGCKPWFFGFVAVWNLESQHRVNGVGRGGGQPVFSQILARFLKIRLKSG